MLMDCSATLAAMRLTPAERATILRVVDRLTEGHGRVWLFG